MQNDVTPIKEFLNENSSEGTSDQTLISRDGLPMSKSIVFNLSYDLLLRLPWHVAHNSRYNRRIVMVGDVPLKFTTTTNPKKLPLMVVALRLMNFRQTLKVPTKFLDLYRVVLMIRVCGLEKLKAKKV